MLNPFFCRVRMKLEHKSPDTIQEILTKNGTLEIKKVAWEENNKNPDTRLIAIPKEDREFVPSSSDMFVPEKRPIS
ncbi:hypothetical protein N9D99_07170 [Gammaproteobacteria bacterium]|nr:hypothetical protein [Gammaproteobacteria bacterium]